MDDLINLEKEKATHGGLRPGSGKKPFVDKLTKIEQQELKEMAKAEFWAEAFKNMAVPFVFQLVQDQDAGKGERLKAAELIINRFLGKPKERHEHSGPDGDAIKTENLNGPEVDKIKAQYEEALRKLILK